MYPEHPPTDEMHPKVYDHWMATRTGISPAEIIERERRFCYDCQRPRTLMWSQICPACKLYEGYDECLCPSTCTCEEDDPNSCLSAIIAKWGLTLALVFWLIVGTLLLIGWMYASVR